MSVLITSENRQYHFTSFEGFAFEYRERRESEQQAAARPERQRALDEGAGALAERPVLRGRDARAVARQCSQRPQLPVESGFIGPGLRAATAASAAGRSVHTARWTRHSHASVRHWQRTPVHTARVNYAARLTQRFAPRDRSRSALWAHHAARNRSESARIARHHRESFAVSRRERVARKPPPRPVASRYSSRRKRWRRRRCSGNGVRHGLCCEHDVDRHLRGRRSGRRCRWPRGLVGLAVRLDIHQAAIADLRREPGARRFARRGRRGGRRCLAALERCESWSSRNRSGNEDNGVLCSRNARVLYYTSNNLCTVDKMS